MKHVKAVIFDWAGTVVDYGSLAPMGAFVETFGEFGVEISIDEARGPMGMAKRPHIAALMALPRVAAAWADRHGAPPGERDIDAVYEVFVPKNTAVAARFSTVIPGVADVVAALRDGGARDRVDHRLHALHHGRDHARRRGARLRARQPRVHRRYGGRPPDPLHDLQDPARSRSLARLGRHQGRRHGGGHRGGLECRHLDGRRGGQRQCLRPVATRHRSLVAAGVRHAQVRRRRQADDARARIT